MMVAAAASTAALRSVRRGIMRLGVGAVRARFAIWLSLLGQGWSGSRITAAFIVSRRHSWRLSDIAFVVFNVAKNRPRRAGVYLAKILVGVKRADLPVEQASKFSFALNVKIAKALGAPSRRCCWRARRRGDRIGHALLRCMSPVLARKRPTIHGGGYLLIEAK